ncbi:MAG: hypothetical protein ACLSF2_00010 [Butyricicoccus sp.]
MMKHLFAALMGIAMTSVGLYMVLPTSPKSKVVAAVKVVNGVVMAICLVLLGIVGIIALGDGLCFGSNTYELIPDYVTYSFMYFFM